MMSDTSGRTSGRQFATYDHDSHSWKMWPDTGLWGLIEYSETWPKTGCMSDGQAFELPTSVPLTTASDFSSSSRTHGSHMPTPKASDGIMGRPRTTGRPIEKSTHLGTIVTVLPSPRAADPKASMTAPSAMQHVRNGFGSLTEVLGFHFADSGRVLPSPKASDSSGGGMHPSKRVGHTQQLIDAVLIFSGDPMPQLFDDGND